MHSIPKFVLFLLFSLILMPGCGGKSSEKISKETLGERLFKEAALSRDGTQSCATCHNPDHAFIDDRVNLTSADSGSPGAVSLGQDEQSLGDINTPSAAYAAFNPAFHFDDEEGLFMGGLFLNGRARTLEDQAKQPFVNPVEMQNTQEQVVATVEAKHGFAMRAVYGNDIFNNDDRAFDAIADSLAEFQRGAALSPFDSKFDRMLKGEVTLSEQEARGLALFVAEDKGNCGACHPVASAGDRKADQLFTDFSYDNLGVPKNELVRAYNDKGAEFVDEGLLNNTLVDDADLAGAFRVVSLRNVGVTGPYMHNGVFNDLKTVVHFYNTRDVLGALNPETNQPWRPAEIDATKNTEELGDLGLTDEEEDDIVAFLLTLTDKRFEHLLAN